VGDTATSKPFQVTTVQETPMERAVTVTGALAAYDQVTLSAKVPGHMQKIDVDLGTVVKKSQLIAQLDQQDYRLRLQQAEAAMSQARARLGLSPDGEDDRVDAEQTATVRQARAVLDDAKIKLDRNTGLFKGGVISQAEMDTADSSYKVALSRYQDALEEIRNRQALLVQRRSELAIAKQQLADTSIIAPFDGVVQEKRASVGEYLAASTAVVVMVRVDPLRLRAEVPERDASSIRTGQPVRVTVEGNTNVYTGQIMRLSPTITERNRMLLVEAEVRNNGTLRPGSFARAEIVSDDKNMAITVPSSAIVTFAGIEKVILVKDGKAVEKPVTTGRHAADRTEILSGVNVGDTIVVTPGNLQSGQSVTVAQ
jgi:RND family efflux transporter MFP subunit